MVLLYKKRLKYKYNLHSLVTYQTNFRLPKIYVGKYITLQVNGLLIIKKGYSWDGPSGPAIDTDTFMRGSLIHDALYQLMRTKILKQSDRMACDQILKDVCLESGMSSIRAWYVYEGVRIGGASAAKPNMLEAP